MSKNITVFLDRNNDAQLTLYKNKGVVEAGVVTKVLFDLPDNVFETTVEEISTDTPYLTLTEGETVVLVNLAGSNLKVGKHYAKVTVFDSASPLGIGWDEVVLDVRYWDFQ